MLAHEPGERKADAVLSRGGLRGVPVREDLRRRLRRHARSRIGDGDVHGPFAFADVDGDPGLAAAAPWQRRAVGEARRGVDGVVDQVAQDGADVGRVLRRQRAQGAAFDDLEPHLPFGGLRGLRHEQRGDRLVADGPADGQVEGLPVPVQRVDVGHDLLLLADLDEPGDGVELVVELVRLRPQRLGRGPERAEVPFQLRQLRPVAQRRHRAEGPPVLLHRHPVHDEHPVALQDHLVGALDGTGEDVAQARGQIELAQGPPEGVIGEVQEAPPDVVHEGDALLRVEGDDALGDPVEHRLPVLGEPGDLPGLHAERLPFDPPRQQPRPEDAEDAGHAEIEQQVGGGADEQFDRGGHFAADDGDAELVPELDAVVGVLLADHRGLGDEFGAAPEVDLAAPAALLEDALAERQRRADEQGVGRGDDDALGVGDAHGRHVPPGQVALQFRGERLCGQRRGQPFAHQVGRGEAFGELRDAPALLGVEHRGRLGDGQPRDGGEHEEDHCQLENEQLTGERRAERGPEHNELNDRYGHKADVGAASG
jgi:hypothetical protein